ncbi:MAG: GNAT family N-acetyltransferase [Candidatus Cloacimonetes bacterium]|nr:GNAT family N-acetyltransferase [Candidatus Cloacimonadota bacterium]
MDNITIVSYNHSYAAGLAKMWNLSSEGWGGYNKELTEEQIIREQDRSCALEVWLALAGEDVVGFCDISVFREDEGALYIDLLNVRPDYYGKKVGKKLVLKAVDYALKSDFPRLDLYTWPGNIKAVPLYKKCGFFWEKDDRTTHLMDFLPSVMQTELVKDDFNFFDWYTDNAREIASKPDGTKENGFDYYTYHWRKDAKFLQMDFCRRGRGLRRIETEAYKIQATVEKLKCVFGTDYTITYEFESKDGSPLDISIQGEDDKNISFNFKANLIVTDKESVTAKFTVNPIDEEYSRAKTHPCVVSRLTVNGKAVCFRVGVAPKFPLSLSISTEDNSFLPDREIPFYLNLKNNFEKEAEFRIVLPEQLGITYREREFFAKIPPKENLLLSSSLKIDKACVLSGFAEVTAKTDREITFRREIGAVFPTFTEQLQGETIMQYLLGFGSYQLAFGKKDGSNYISYGYVSGKENGAYCPTFDVGMPYLSAFNQTKPVAVEWLNETYATSMVCRYRSDKLPDMELELHLRLRPNGMLERWFEAVNCGEEAWQSPRKVKWQLWVPRGKVVVPYRKHIVEVPKDTPYNIDCWQKKDYDENWYFSGGDDHTYCLCWDPSESFEGDEWSQIFEHELGCLNPGERTRTNPVTICIDTFRDWKELRRYALPPSIHPMKKLSDKPKRETLDFDASPIFHKGEVKLLVDDWQGRSFNGSICLESSKQDFESVTKAYTAEDGVKKLEETVKCLSEQDIITASLNLNMPDQTCQRAVFKMSETPVQVRRETLQKHEIITAENGILTLKSDKAFQQGLFAMEYKGRNWLDNSWPKHTAKSWWSPWSGGFYVTPAGIGLSKLMEQKITMGEAEAIDNRGNVWRGIYARTIITDEDKLKNLCWESFYLLLPGVPVVAKLMLIKQNRQAFVKQNFLTALYVKAHEDIKRHYIYEFDEKYTNKCHAGFEEYDPDSGKGLVFGHDDLPEQLYFWSPDISNEVIMNNEILSVRSNQKYKGAYGDKKLLKSDYLIITEERLTPSMLSDMQNIKFDINKIDFHLI